MILSIILEKALNKFSMILSIILEKANSLSGIEKSQLQNAFGERLL